MTEKNGISRRRMLGQSLKATAAGLAAPCAWFVPRSAWGANDRIGVGIIGCGRRNGQLVIGKGGQGAPPAHAKIVAVADLNLKRAAEWAKNYRCTAYQDYRALLDQKDVAVVLYATPEHWHYLPCIHACQAGKDIYGEQPLSHTIREGRRMIEAVRKYGRVFQTGEQQRSHPATRKAVELIRNGRIGKIQAIIGYNYPSAWESDLPAQPCPEWLDWDRWCGPNEVVPFHYDVYLSRIPYEREPPYYSYPAEKYAVGPGWMSFRPFSGGELPNEKLETVVYHLPEKRDRGDAACSKTIINYKYPNGVVLSLRSIDPKLGGGATFIGEKGKITVFREGYECDPADLDKDPLPPNATRVYQSDNHMDDFFACVVSRKDPIMPVEAGHSVATLCHLGNIARRLGRRLRWDPLQEVFPGDDEANQHLDIPRRNGYELPEKV